MQDICVCVGCAVVCDWVRLR